jgi:hypothetical protein
MLEWMVVLSLLRFKTEIMNIWRTPKLFDGLTTSPKMKTTEGKGVGAHSLVCSILGVKGRVGTLGWGLRRLTNNSITHTYLHKNQTTNWLVHSCSTFGAHMNHRQTQIHKTHHGPDLGEAITFPLIIYFVHGHGTSTQMSFCPKTPKWESWNSQSWDSRDFGVP